MTTAVMNYGTMVVGERPRRSLEELVDRVMDALFASNHEQPQEIVARRAHNARRLRKVGDLDGALAVFASVEPDTTGPNEVRWAYAEWLSLVRRTCRDRDLLVYSLGTGRAAALAPHGAGTVEVLAVLGALRLPYGLLLVHDWYFQGVLLRGEGWEGYVSAQWVGAVAGGRDVDHLGVTG